MNSYSKFLNNNNILILFRKVGTGFAIYSFMNLPEGVEKNKGKENEHSVKNWKSHGRWKPNRS